VSQETCLDYIHVLGRVSRWCGCDSARAPPYAESRRVTSAFAPTFGLSHVIFYIVYFRHLHFLASRCLPRHATYRPAPRAEIRAGKFLVRRSDEKALIEAGAGLRAANWARQKKLGVSVIPSNDFSFYDQMLDTSVMVGAIPEIYRWNAARSRSRPILRWPAARKVKRKRQAAAMPITPTRPRPAYRRRK